MFAVAQNSGAGAMVLNAGGRCPRVRMTTQRWDCSMRVTLVSGLEHQRGFIRTTTA